MLQGVLSFLGTQTCQGGSIILLQMKRRPRVVLGLLFSKHPLETQVRARPRGWWEGRAGLEQR